MKKFSLLMALRCVVLVAAVQADLPSLTSKTIDDMAVDHSAQPATQDKYKHRYLYNTDGYSNGPVLFFAGGEGDVTVTAKTQTFLRSLAKNLSAAVVFAEHRYYGESLPYGADSTNNMDNLKYLTVENVLADYVEIIHSFRKDVIRNEQAPVIAYGSKYGGMLAAWLRLKHNNTVAGALASSAPVLDFPGNGVKLGDYDKRVTDIYVKTGGCNRDSIKRAFDRLMNIATAKELSDVFKLKPKITDNSKISAGRDTVLYLARNALYQMAEHNFPYETQFGHNGQMLPADPVKKACSSLKSTDDPKDEGATDLKNLAAAISTYYDIGEICVDETGKDCKYVPGTVQPTLAEAFEHCNGMALYRCPMDGENDFFPADGNRYCPTTNDFPSKIDGKCNDWLQAVKDYKGGINTEWIQKHIGYDFSQAKNIIFTTGSLDTNAGGIYVPKDADAANGVYSYNVERYVSGQDLLEPNTCDSNTLKNARFQIVKIMKCWSGLLSGDACRPDKLKTDLPRLDESTPSKCEQDAYPYGQKEGDSGSKGASIACLSMLAIFGSIILAA